MDLHSYDKAKNLRIKIKSVRDQLESITDIGRVNIVRKQNNMSLTIDDFKKSIVEGQCCTEIDDAQHNLVASIRKALQDYIVRLEEQFDKI